MTAFSALANAQETDEPSDSSTPLSTISVRVSGAEPDTGTVGANLYASEAAFLESPLERLRVAVDSEGVALVTFTPVAAGDYAVSAYWDENDNGKMDTGFMRIPKERVGFSNNAKGRFGPAKWKDARFEVGSEALEIDIDLVNARD